MAQISARHTHKFSIADQDAVRVLIDKLGPPHGSRSVDEKRLIEAPDIAARERFADFLGACGSLFVAGGREWRESLSNHVRYPKQGPTGELTMRLPVGLG